MSHLSLSLLGPPQIETDNKFIELETRKAMALLVYLAVTKQPHSRDALATLLWPKYDQSSALAYLRRILSMLNRALGEDWLVIDRETAGLNPDAGLWLDVDVFHQQLSACGTHGHPPTETCPDCVLL